MDVVCNLALSYLGLQYIYWYIIFHSILSSSSSAELYHREPRSLAVLSFYKMPGIYNAVCKPPPILDVRHL